MNFEFLIAYNRGHEVDIEQILLDLLTNVLEENLYVFEPAMVMDMIKLRHERAGTEFINENGVTICHMLLGFVLDLPEEIEQIHAVVNEFSEALCEASPIFHAVKFVDPLLRNKLTQWSEEIFALEMKLRRVLTFIYLHASQAIDPYDLLREESVQPMSREKPTPAQMKAATENQFFHLTFGQYVGLNKRPEFKLPDLLTTIRDQETYDSFRNELRRSPVQHEDDAVLLAGLKERMDAIEKMRNCIAHNRQPSRNVIENYENVRPLLDGMLDDYLSQWEVDNIIEMPWHDEAHGAVQCALENSDWDDEAKTITLFDSDDERHQTTVTNREDLVRYLSEIAAIAFYANAPSYDGEFVTECDEDSIVESALSGYEDRLSEFFTPSKK